jgi:hypothetical protein
MSQRIRRTVALALAFSLSHAGLVHAAASAGAPPAAQLIGAEEVAAGVSGRALLEQTLARADVAAALEARGVSVQSARERVASLTDAEAATLAAEIDKAPAGADAIGVIVFIFVLLLLTDILGFTKIFPFTRSIR